MALVKIDVMIQKVSDGTAASGTLTVKLRGSETDAAVYNSSGSPISAAVPTVNGRVEAWVNEGSYDLRISGAGFATYNQQFEATSGTTILALAPKAGPTFTGTSTFQGPLVHQGTQAGFYNSAPVNQSTGWGASISPPAIGTGKTQLSSTSTLNDTIRYVSEMAKVLRDLGIIGT